MGEPLRVVLTGYLTSTTLEQSLQPVEERLRGDPQDRFCMLIDALAMLDYEPEARQKFVSFFAAHRARFICVAIVTNRSIWTMAIAAMALASGLQMRAFANEAAATVWANSR